MKNVPPAILLAVLALLPVHAQVLPPPPPLLPMTEYGEEDLVGSVSAMEDEFDSATEAYIRVWTLIPPDEEAAQIGAVGKFSQPIRLEAIGSGGEPLPLVSNPYPFMLSGYRPVSSGKFELRLSQGVGEEAVNRARTEVELPPGSFTTVVISRDSTGTFQVLVDLDSTTTKVDDKLVVKSRFPGLTVVNPFENLRSAVVAEGSAMRIIVNPSDRIHFPNVPRQIIPTKIVSEIDGNTFSSEVELDFRVHDSLTCLFIRDLYGRYVPAVLPNSASE